MVTKPGLAMGASYCATVFRTLALVQQPSRSNSQTRIVQRHAPSSLKSAGAAGRTTAVLLAVALFATACHTRTAERASRQSGRIVVLGDSLAVSPSEAQGFPGVLEQRLQSHGLSWSVINAGVRGDTTAGGLRRIDALLAANRPDILIIALGANDGMRKLGVEQMADNLGAIIRRAQDHGSEVLLCGMQLPPLNLFSYGKEFRDAFGEVANEHDVPLVPFLLEGVALNPGMNGTDGIHPNADGARRIAETIWPYLDEMIGR
jgi:acyl-CoA thioesterase-1